MSEKRSEKDALLAELFETTGWQIALERLKAMALRHRANALDVMGSDDRERLTSATALYTLKMTLSELYAGAGEEMPADLWKALE